LPRASSTACSVLAALALAGCGSGAGSESPALPEEVGTLLAEKTDDVTASLESGDLSEARAQALELRSSAVRAIESGRVPPELRRPLLAAVNRLVASVPTPSPPPPTEETDEDEGNKGKGKDKEKDGEDGD